MISQKLLSISLFGTEWILYLLILFSVLSWAVICERFFFLSKKKKNIDQLEDKIRGLLEQGEAGKVLQLLEHDRSSTFPVAAKLISYVTKRGTNVEEYMAVVLSQEKMQLESRLVFLGTMVSTAPFIGLLGTVLGIINAFHGLSINKQGGDMVMAGISQALVATALGLFIAIPAAAAYNYFIRMIKRITVSSENFARFLLISYPSNDSTRTPYDLPVKK